MKELKPPIQNISTAMDAIDGHPYLKDGVHDFVIMGWAMRHAP